MTPLVIMDISQLVSWPARSGVQRLLLELFRHWPDDILPIEAGFQLDDCFFLVSPQNLCVEMERLFSETGDIKVDEFQARLIAVGDRHRDPRGVIASASAYFLPEPTYTVETLSRVREFYRSGRPTFALVMDALPALKPWLFPGRHQGVTDGYFQLISGLDHVAFISQEARDQVESRLRHRPFDNGLVATPGADGLPPTSDPHLVGSHFVVVGTLEPRKRTGLVLQAMREVARTGSDLPVVVIGAPGSDTATIEILEDPPAHLTWLRRAHDQEVATQVASARAMIFVGADEGFGLPPLEAMKLGCPVIVSRDLPSLRDLPPFGQIRLSVVTVDSVAAAVRALNRENVNAALRQELGKLQLPSWKVFSSRLATWAAATIAASA
jgi:Glycosyl transferases group 1